KDVLITNMVVTPAKLATIAGLTQSARIGLLFDDEEQIKRAGQAFAAAGTRADAYIEIEVGGERWGVLSPARAVELARAIAGQKALSFAGLQAYHGRAQHMRSRAERREAARNAGGIAQKVKAALESAGFACPRITGAGTGSFVADAEVKVLDELQCGSYAFMDRDY